MSDDPIRARLEQAIPHPVCELRHDSAWQLLVATILSAQATDKRVNQVTPELFRRWPTPAALGAASQEEVEVVVKTTGFFRNKARAIREASQQLVERFDGEVPRTVAEAVTLRGVARKTANLVLGTAMGIAEGIVVDTHVSRVSLRLGLTAEKDPVKVERDLCARYPREIWVDMGHRLLLHGRYVCVARKPRCGGCPLNECCPAAEAPAEGALEERVRAEREAVEAAIRSSVGGDS